MIVASSVVLPTPLRPRTESDPRSGRAKPISSITTVSPYPARTSLRVSASAMTLLPEVDLVHALVAPDFIGRALDQHLALDEHGDAPREAEHQVHVVLDDEDRDLDEALLAVGQVEDALLRVVGESQRREQRHALVADVGVRARGAQHSRRHATALGDREGDVVEHREPPEERVDLERAAEAELHALRLAERGDVLVSEQDAARGRRQDARQHVHERGLPRAVRPDEGMARARLEAEVDLLGHGERTEGLAQRAGFEGRAHAFLRSLAISPSRMPRMPPRANRTTSTSIVPIPRYQYSGNCFASRSWAMR